MNSTVETGKRKRVLFFSAHSIGDASYRYRIQQYFPYLEAGGFACTSASFSTSALFQMLNERGRIASKAVHTVFSTLRRIGQIATSGAYDLVVIHREVFPFLTPTFEKWVLHRNPRVIFSFDDAIYARHENLSELPHPWLYRLKYRGGIEDVLRQSVHVIAGNRILAGYAARFNTRVSIFPTVVDCSKYQVRFSDSNSNRKLTIGWMGSRSTAPYLADIVPALRCVAEANPGRIRFRMFGCPQLTLELPDYESLPFRVDSELEDLAGIDIGIMPMPDTEWTRGKCAFKAIQYMASGKPSVVSPVGVTPDIVENNRTGLTATNCDEWFHALNRLVKDSNLRREIALNGRNFVEKQYSIQVWGPRLATLFSDVHRQGPIHSPRTAVPAEVDS